MPTSSLTWVTLYTLCQADEQQRQIRCCWSKRIPALFVYIPWTAEDVILFQLCASTCAEVKGSWQILHDSRLALLQIRGFACDCAFPEQCDSQASELPPTRLQQQELKRRLHCEQAAPADSSEESTADCRSNGEVAEGQECCQGQAATIPISCEAPNIKRMRKRKVLEWGERTTVNALKSSLHFHVMQIRNDLHQVQAVQLFRHACALRTIGNMSRASPWSRLADCLEVPSMLSKDAVLHCAKLKAERMKTYVTLQQSLSRERVKVKMHHQWRASMCMQSMKSLLRTSALHDLPSGLRWQLLLLESAFIYQLVQTRTKDECLMSQLECLSDHEILCRCSSKSYMSICNSTFAISSLMQ